MTKNEKVFDLINNQEMQIKTTMNYHYISTRVSGKIF